MAFVRRPRMKSSQLKGLPCLQSADCQLTAWHTSSVDQSRPPGHKARLQQPTCVQHVQHFAPLASDSVPGLASVLPSTPDCNIQSIAPQPSGVPLILVRIPKLSGINHTGGCCQALTWTGPDMLASALRSSPECRYRTFGCRTNSTATSATDLTCLQGGRESNLMKQKLVLRGLWVWVGPRACTS